MKKYSVKLREVWVQEVIVEADNEEEAERKVHDGDGEYTDYFEYSHTIEEEASEAVILTEEEYINKTYEKSK